MPQFNQSLSKMDKQQGDKNHIEEHSHNKEES